MDAETAVSMHILYRQSSHNQQNIRRIGFKEGNHDILYTCVLRQVSSLLTC